MSFTDRVLYGNSYEELFAITKSPEKTLITDQSKIKKDPNLIKKRKRKSGYQLKVLKMEYQKDEFWSKEKILKISQSTGLTESQVYKWCWDQKKKIESDTPKKC